MPSPTRLRISDPADLVAAVPALLGFRPHRSLVAICLGGESGKSLGGVIRHDLVVDGDDVDCLSVPVVAAIERFAQVCVRERAQSVIAVIVDDEEGHDRLHDNVAVGLEERLAEVNVVLLGTHVTHRIAAGERWWSLLGETLGGHLPDPDASAAAAAHVLEGRQIRASRDEITALFVGDERERSHVAELIDKAEQSWVLERDLAARKGDSIGYFRRKLEHVLWQISNVESGAALLAPEMADLALAIAEPVVRESLLALAVGDQAGAAEQLWLRMVRALPEPERSDAATLLGYSAYVRGDGPLAGVALLSATASDPANRMALLFDDALQAGVRPDVIRDIASTGYDCAQRLGVRLPPPVPVTQL
jgi:hypothetical protein